MPAISDDNHRAKMEFIRAFFDDFDEKVAYLEDLYKSNHRDEAAILCSCYIDSLALALYFPDDRSNFNFVKCLREHGSDDIFSHFHPIMLDEALRKLSKRGGKWAKIYTTVTGTLKTMDKRLYSDREITDLLTTLLNTSGMKDIEQQLWRGTFAAIVYERFRIAAVHGFGPPDGTTFDSTTFKDRPVPVIDYSMVHNCLKRIVALARDVSEKTGRWFGARF